MWRVVSSGRFGASLVEVQTEWSLTDVLDACDVLDLLDDLELKRNRR